jgi:hypothetical protein
MFQCGKCSVYIWKHMACTCDCYHQMEVCIQEPLVSSKWPHVFWIVISLFYCGVQGEQTVQHKLLTQYLNKRQNSLWGCLWSIAINEVGISFQVSISIRVIVDTVEFLNAFTPVQLFDTVEHDNPVLHGVLFLSSMHLYCQELTPVSEGDCQHSLVMWNTSALCTYTLCKGNIYQHVAQATNHVYSDTFINHSRICCFPASKVHFLWSKQITHINNA